MYMNVMRKNKFVSIVLALFAILIITSIMVGCDENKDTKLGRLEQENKILKIENARLRRDCAISGVQGTGDMFLFVEIGASFVFVNNLIWVVAWKRRK